jgi:hypothetical protein
MILRMIFNSTLAEALRLRQAGFCQTICSFRPPSAHRRTGPGNTIWSTAFARVEFLAVERSPIAGSKMQSLEDAT